MLKRFSSKWSVSFHRRAEYQVLIFGWRQAALVPPCPSLFVKIFRFLTPIGASNQIIQCEYRPTPTAKRFGREASAFKPRAYLAIVAPRYSGEMALSRRAKPLLGKEHSGLAQRDPYRSMGHGEDRLRLWPISAPLPSRGRSVVAGKRFYLK